MTPRPSDILASRPEPGSVRLPILALLVAALAGIPPVAATAQEVPPGGEPARILVLGVYHFANPGLDIVQFEVPDVLSAEKQEEVRRVVDGLARFGPTKVAVEQRVEQAAELDSLYRAYREGGHALGRNETQQLGFRLAARFDHPGVHPVDHRGDFPFEPVVEYAAEHDPAFLEWFEATTDRIATEQNERLREETVAEVLRGMNDPVELEWGHAAYLETAAVGAGDTQVGADLLADWYERNIRIFSNIRALAGAGERIVVIVGAGHAPILRELARADPRVELVDPLGYLPER